MAAGVYMSYVDMLATREGTPTRASITERGRTHLQHYRIAAEVVLRGADKTRPCSSSSKDLDIARVHTCASLAMHGSAIGETPLQALAPIRSAR